MFLTLRSLSLVLASLAMLPAGGCSLEREGSADEPTVADAPTTVDPVEDPIGQIARDAATAPASDASVTAPSPSLQTDSGSADMPTPPSADKPVADVADAGSPAPSAPGKPAEPPADPPPPEPPTQPAQPSTPPPSAPTPSDPPPSDPPPSDPPPSNPPPSSPPASDPPPPPRGFALGSPAFAPGSELPAQYSACGGVSPPFVWEGAPSGVGSYALTLEQLDYGSGSSRMVWAMTNIPGDATRLSAGAAAERAGFDAPVCGRAARYTYTLYALSQRPSIGRGVQTVTRTTRVGGEVVFQPSGVLGAALLTANVSR